MSKNRTIQSEPAPKQEQSGRQEERPPDRLGTVQQAPPGRVPSPCRLDAEGGRRGAPYHGHTKEQATGASRPYWWEWPSRRRVCSIVEWPNALRSIPMTWNGARCTRRTAGRSTSCRCRRSSPRRSSGSSFGWPGRTRSTAQRSPTPAGTARNGGVAERQVQQAQRA